MDFAVYASRALVERVGEGAGLGAFPWIHWDERLNMRWLDEWLAKHAPGARVALRVGANTRAVHDAIVAGIGVHFLACFDGDADASLVRIGPVDPQFSRDLWLLTLSEMRGNSRVRAFIDHFDEHSRPR
jgi:DNA-binding transcriptional LysR family regulator